ncbi:hypothetical protein HY989_04065 [Candidatus Micrarchaeota archaeon]|nr:hypothetical protein [Candidatus Micrarchaeota archaeon]
MVRKKFDRSVHYLPALLNFRPQVFDNETISEAVAKTKENIYQRFGEIKPQHADHLDNLLSFAKKVSDHIRTVGKNKAEKRKLFGAHPSGRLANWAPNERGNYFMAEVSRARTLLDEFKRNIVLNDFLVGKLSSAEASKKAFPDRKVELEKDVDGNRVIFKYASGGSHSISLNAAMNPLELRKELTNIVFYLGWKFHPKYTRSYYVDSLEPIGRAVKGISERDLNTSRFYASLTRDVDGMSLEVKRFMVFMQSPPRELDFIIGHADKYPLPQGLPSKNELVNELELVRDIKQKNPKRLTQFLNYLSTFPMEEQFAFFLRTEPRWLSTFKKHIEREKLNLPEIKTGIGLSRELLQIARKAFKKALE